jgi:hypothetical protein
MRGYFTRALNYLYQKIINCNFNDLYNQAQTKGIGDFDPLSKIT